MLNQGSPVDETKPVDVEAFEANETHLSIADINSLLDSDKKDAIIQALYNISELGAKAQLFVPKIVYLTMCNDRHTRQAAISALAKLRSDETLIVYTLKKCLYDPDAFIRRSAASALIQFSHSGKQAVYELADRVLNDDDTVVQELCCHALGEMGPRADVALPALIQHLQHGNNTQRIASCRTIARIAQAAELAKPALIQALRDDNSHVRRFAATALTLLNPAT